MAIIRQLKSCSIRSQLACSFCMLFIACLLTPAVLRADWNPGDPAKWVQSPDLSQTGMDVWDTVDPFVTNPSIGGPVWKILADDFLCKQTGPITDIHIWGSWRNNILPQGPTGGTDPGNVMFKLSIHADVPAGADPIVPWSHPGPELWQAVLPASSVRLYAPTPGIPGTILEQFYDPNRNLIDGQDNEVYQYNFTKLPMPFMQQGTPSNPIVYWLDVQAATPDPNAIFGWKTSLQHWGDDAVFADTDVFNGHLSTDSIWTDMHYPSGHPLAPDSIDLSFVITTVPEPASFALLGIALLAATLFGQRRRIA